MEIMEVTEFEKRKQERRAKQKELKKYLKGRQPEFKDGLFVFSKTKYRATFRQEGDKTIFTGFRRVPYETKSITELPGFK